MNLNKCLRQFAGFASSISICAVLIGTAAAEMADTSSQDFKILPAFGEPTQTTNGPAVTQTEVVADQAMAPMLQSNSGALMLAAEQRYADIASRGGFPKISKTNLKKGSKGTAVAALNQRLFMEGYLRAEGTQGEYAALYTSATEDSVSRFQRNMGIAVTGRVDGVTQFYLNIPVAERLATIRANIPRLQIYEQNLGDRYLVVNVPAQQVETVNNGRVYSRHNAIVGRPERPSPVVITSLETVKFNPYWNAPVSIVEKDIIPKLRSGTQVLSDMNFKVFQGVGGPEIDPRSVNWSSAVADDYAFRQEPGPDNAMATAKVEFISPFGIYLHDTPERQLFKTSNRFYSSGCVRVDQMPLLAQWILNGQDGFGESKISTMAETLERLDVLIMDPPELRVAYLTAWPSSKGTVAFRKDIYKLDGSGFTVGQPMPVGETSPDGLRYVLKPLPRQIAEAAEAEGFGLFHFGGVKKMKARDKSGQKSLFGKPLLTSDSNKNSSVQSSLITKKPKPTASGKKSSGLFDWAAYRKSQGIAPIDGKPKKLVKKTKSTSKVPVVKVAAKKVKKPADTFKGTIPPEPQLDTPIKPVAAKGAPPVKPVACKAGTDGKLPASCKPVVEASKALPKPKA